MTKGSGDEGSGDDGKWICLGQSTKPCVFPCKVAAGDDERYLVCATGAAAVVPDAIGSFYVFCNKWLFLWCRSMRFLKL